jgi:cyclohexyl-isocyanide hydratase
MLRDQAYAETVQLIAEYAPEPPFNAGSPRTALSVVKDVTKATFPDFNARARAALVRSSERRRSLY